MLTVGIDSGSKNTKAVAVKDGAVIGTVSCPTGFDTAQVADEMYKELLTQIGVEEKDVDAVAATGNGRNVVAAAQFKINEVSSATRGILHVCPDAKMVLDIGAESCKAIRIQEDGSVGGYEVNDKCASGSGTFIEAMCRVLGVKVDEIGPLALRHTKKLPMNAQCVVFAESEVISLIHQKESAEDIAYSIHTGIVNRVMGIVRRLGVSKNVAMIGGPALNVGFISCLEEELHEKVMVPEIPQFVSAIGAAVYAADNAGKE